MTEATFPWADKPRHWRDKVIAWGARRIAQPRLASPAPWTAHRRGFEKAAGLRRFQKARGVSVRPIELGPLGALEISPPKPERRLVWIHGGGFVVGSPETHLVMLTHLARTANALVIAPRYRLAPEDPYPAGPEDAESAVTEAMTYRGDVGPLTLGGDSAGGCLALVALQKLLKDSTAPAGVLLFSPATITDPARPVPDADDLLFPEEVLHRIGASYSINADPRDPRFAPVHGTYTGAPPTLIQCVSREYLEEDSDAIAARLTGQGVQVTLEKVARMQHVWQFMAGSSPLADDAIARAAAFMRGLG
ncbi:MAG: alpha/beta hydrolase [Rhodobacteraceae bacterium]|nr:alpha/beta hydrolase [Paracoccaceae bacterium]